MEKKIIYLDQNAWIYFAQAYYGKNTDNEMKKACDLAIKLSSENHAIFPLSVVHLMESLSTMNFEKMERLAKFVMKISQGYTMLPYRDSVVKMEINEAVSRKFGLPHIPIRDIVISKGISHLFASIPEIRGSIPEDMKKKLIGFLESPESLLWLLMNKEAPKFPKRENENLELLSKLENLRREDSKIKDKTLRRNVALFKYFCNSLLPEVIRQIQKLGLNGYLLF